MARPRNQRSRFGDFCVEALETRNLMTARIGSTFMLVDVWTSKPLSVASAQLVKMSIKNSSIPTHHVSVNSIQPSCR